MIDGRGSPIDFIYAHLAEPSPLQEGEAVRTGQPIGVVGDTGGAGGCHLHLGPLQLSRPAFPAAR